MKLLSKVAGLIDEHVAGNTKIADGAVASAAAEQMRGSVVRHDDHEVIVAVRARVSTGNGAEQTDAFRVVGVHEAADHFSQDRIFGRGLCRGVWEMGGHLETVWHICGSVGARRTGSG